MRQFSVRARMVDGGRKLLRQNLGNLIDRDVELGSQLLDRVAAQYLLELLSRDRQGLPVSDPGFDLIAQTRLLQLGNDRRQSALIAVAQYLAQHNRQNSALQLSEHALEGR